MLGEFNPDDRILIINQNGDIQLIKPEMTTHFDENLIIIEKHVPKKTISAIHFDGQKKSYFVKRFLADDHENKYSVITSHKDSFLEIVSTDWIPMLEIIFVKEKGKERKKEHINLSDFISIKGSKALGNKLTNKKVKEINLLDPLKYDPTAEDVNEDDINRVDKIEGTPNVQDEGSQQISLEL